LLVRKLIKRRGGDAQDGKLNSKAYLNDQIGQKDHLVTNYQLRVYC
jgi:hypothetical protein